MVGGVCTDVCLVVMGVTCDKKIIQSLGLWGCSRKIMGITCDDLVAIHTVLN